MKKVLLKIVVSLLVFLITIAVAESYMNRGNINTTREMEMASLPVVYMNITGKTVNELYGYTGEVKVSLLKENITPLDENRGVSFRIAKYGARVSAICVKIKTVNADRLIENITIEDYEEDTYGISGSVTFKDLIMENTEYSFEMYLTLGDGREVMYHTRVIDAPDYCALEKINFVTDFHTKSMKKETAESLRTYMECNSSADNTTLAYVNIHSSMEQLSFGDMNVYEYTEPIVSIKELARETGVFTIDYIAAMDTEDTTQLYFVKEMYRIKYSSSVTYLLDYERTMRRITDDTTLVPSGSTILLGITDPDIGIKESEDGNVFAFISENKLYSYNITENRMAKLFSFYDSSNFDERTWHDEHKIKILSIDEAGNVWYAVYGYMNRGTYEGRTGIALYCFDSVMSVTNEITFISTDRPAEIVIRDLDRLSYLSKNGVFNFFLDSAVYAFDTESKKTEVIVSNLEDNLYSVSESHAMIVWQNGSDVNMSTSLNVYNMNTMQTKEVLAPEGQRIKPLAFLGEDLMYGVAYAKDVALDSVGRVVFPMHTVKIQNEYGVVLKTYSEQDTYITDIERNDNLIVMKRVKKISDSPNAYTDIEDDYMTNNQAVEQVSNSVMGVAVDVFETILYIKLSRETSGKVVWVIPKEVIYEGSNEASFEKIESKSRHYYVYYKGRLQKIFDRPAQAINLANTNYGTVLGDDGFYVWYRGNRDVRNQIMELSFDEVDCEAGKELGYCLDSILNYAGSYVNATLKLEQGQSVLRILTENLEKKNVLDLKGVPLDSVLYYVNRNIPVLAFGRNEKPYVIIGFNQLAVVILDPESGWYKIGMNEAEELFEEGNNHFITYISIES